GGRSVRNGSCRAGAVLGAGSPGGRSARGPPAASPRSVTVVSRQSARAEFSTSAHRRSRAPAGGPGSRAQPGPPGRSADAAAGARAGGGGGAEQGEQRAQQAVDLDTGTGIGAAAGPGHRFPHSLLLIVRTGPRSRPAAPRNRGCFGG